MRGALGLVGLALLAALAFLMRVQPSMADAGARGGAYATLADPEGDYRLRLVELALVTSHVPQRDRFLGLDAKSSLPPWPPLVHATLAVCFSYGLPRSEDAVELRGIEEQGLERARAWIGPLLAALAVLGAGALALYFAQGHASATAALVVGCVAALHPLGLAREFAGSLSAHGWIVLLSLAQVGALALALRGTERVDAFVGALGGGFCAALALLAGAEAWPVSAAVLAAFVHRALRAPREQSRDPWRAVLAFVGTALAVLAIPREDDAPSLWMPDPDTGGLLHCAPDTLALSLAPLACGLVLSRRTAREPLAATLLAANALALACALVDRRFFAPLVAASLALLALALARTALEERRGWSAALAAVVVLAAPALLRGRNDAFDPDALPHALRWLRERSSSPGAFNHPEAEQSWRVAAPPALAGSVALHARRGVVGASFEGARAPLSPALAAIFAATEPVELAAALARADAPYLVVTPPMLRDAELALAPGALVARMATQPNLDLAGALEAVYVSPQWITPEGERAESGEVAGPAVAIYRRLGVRSAEDVPSLAPSAR